MRKTIIFILVIFLFLTTLTACTNYTFETKEVEATVISCQQGTLIPSPEYVSLANMYLIKKNTAMYTMYMSLAHSNGSYNYNITINIDGSENHVVVRNDSYEAGEIIIVTAKYSYADGKLVSIEYD